MVWLWHPCKCDTFLKRGHTAWGTGSRGERERQPGFVSLMAVGLARLGSPPAHQSQLWYRPCWWCPCCPRPPAGERAGPGFAREEVVLRGTKWRSLEAAAVSDQRSPRQFCHLLLWLFSGFSGARWEDRSCRKFAITSLSAVGFLDSHPIVSAFPWHVNAWMRGGGNETADGGHFESQVVSAPTEGLILNMQIIFSSTFPSSC